MFIWSITAMADDKPRKLQVFIRQIFAIPVDGGLLIGQRLTAANVNVDQVRIKHLCMYACSLAAYCIM